MFAPPVPDVAFYETLGLTAFVIAVIAVLVWAFMRSVRHATPAVLVHDLLEALY